MEIAFWKMHGTLNDFVVFHDLEGSIELTGDQVAHICDRRAGVGADGLIVVRSSAHADFFMDYVNSDGSVAEMCGNGIRCLAKYVYDSGLKKATTLAVETRAGIKALALTSGADGTIERVRVDMGEPIFDPVRIPVTIDSAGSSLIDCPVEAEGRRFPATILSMGNPHCVIVAEEDLEALPAIYGPSIERHVLFPARTNVEFIRVENRNRIRMRVWERGSGETFACGTGACAVAVAARLKGLVSSPTVVSLLGGDLEIEWSGNGSSVFMTGPSVLVYTGRITI